MKSSITYTMKTHSGLTLIELLVTLAVLSILIAVAAPNFTSYTSGNKVVTLSNDMIGALAYARSEAVTRNTTVYVATADSVITGALTAPASSASSTWTSGWQVVWYDTTAGKLVPLKQSGPMQSTFEVLPTTLPKSIVFNPDGSSNAFIDMSICDKSNLGNTGRMISILNTGRVSSSTVPCT